MIHSLLGRCLRGALVLSLLVGGATAQGACADGPRAGPTAGEDAGASADDRVRRLAPRVLASHPHRADAFTQGLLFHDGFLYESTGQYGASTLRKVAPETGEVLVRRDLPPTLFGEGLALVPGPDGGRLIQLTWRSGLALVWELETLERAGDHEYTGEGWGLTFDGEHLVMSDGSSWLSYRDPETFAEVHRRRVTMAGRPLSRLNELEWVEGAVWANIWGTSSVVRIDPADGEVTAIVDLSTLYELLEPEEAAGVDVLNGIAYRPGEEPGGGLFFVTGKYWPRLFGVVFEAP